MSRSEAMSARLKITQEVGAISGVAGVEKCSGIFGRFVDFLFVMMFVNFVVRYIFSSVLLEDFSYEFQL